MAGVPVADLIGLLIAASGVSAGLYQYNKNSGRERAVKAADEMEKLHTDPNVNLAFRLFDYGSSNMSLQIYSERHEAVVVTKDDVKSALAHHLDRLAENDSLDPPRPLFTSKEYALREIFDGFLIRLERIEHLISKEVISEEDFGDLFSYWLELLGERARPDDTLTHFTDARRKRLWKYIRLYQFNGVVRLFGRYGRAAPEKTPPQLAFVPRPPVTDLRSD
jgi:hypothetical protein